MYKVTLTYKELLILSNLSQQKLKIKVCLWNTDYAPGGKSKKAIVSAKVKVKVKRSLTLVSFKRASLVEYVCQIWSLYL